MKQKSKITGITLIALVITIVVLLILAGVSIAMLTGENGILTQVQKSKTAGEKGDAEDRIKLVLNEWQIEKNKADVTDLETFLKNKVISKELDKVIKNAKGTYSVEVGEYKVAIDENGELSIVKPGQRAIKTVKDNYTEPDGTKTATIPVGYTVSNIDEEKNIDSGLVIYEIPENVTINNWTADENNNGIYDVQERYNQFVWIPATESTYVRNITYSNTNISTTAYTDKDYLPIIIQPTINSSITDEKQIGTVNENAEKAAVLSAGGFYISRYEAGKEKIEGVDTLVSKKGASVWVSIEQETTKTTAKTANSNYALCSVIQWDVTMSFVNGKLDGATLQQIFNVTTASSARHTGIGSSITSSGQNEADRVCNIYDLEGNTWEYVAEKNTANANAYVIRGGGYNNMGVASSRSNFSNSANGGISFRFTLYVI